MENKFILNTYRMYIVILFPFSYSIFDPCIRYSIHLFLLFTYFVFVFTSLIFRAKWKELGGIQ